MSSLFFQMSLLLALRITSPLLAAVSVAVTSHLVWRHWHSQTCSVTRRHLLLILPIAPFYAITAAVCVQWPQLALWMELLRECYETGVLWAFYQLLLQYLVRQCGRLLSPPERLDYSAVCVAERSFLALEPVVWRCCTIKPSRTLFAALKWSVLQYVLLRPLSVLLTVTLALLDMYRYKAVTLDSVYLWQTVGASVSLTLTLGSLWLLIQLTEPVTALYSPTLKLLAIKALVFFVFWQSLLLACAAYWDAVPWLLLADDWSLDQTVEVLQSALLCLEMAWMALCHHWIFEPE